MYVCMCVCTCVCMYVYCMFSLEYTGIYYSVDNIVYISSMQKSLSGLYQSRRVHSMSRVLL